MKAHIARSVRVIFFCIHLVHCVRICTCAGQTKFLSCGFHCPAQSFNISQVFILFFTYLQLEFLTCDCFECRAFEVRCLHIPVYDRTPFEGLRLPQFLVYCSVLTCAFYKSFSVASISTYFHMLNYLFCQKIDFLYMWLDQLLFLNGEMISEIITPQLVKYGCI